MGTSAVGYRGRAFTAPDPVLEVWLRLLVDEIDAMDDRPDWLREARDDWYTQATEEFGYGIVPELDRYLVDEQRCVVVLELAKRALSRLHAFGDPIPASRLNGLGAGRSGEGFPRDLPAAVFVEPARAFIALLAERPE